jgi:hypothetical protein
MSRAFYSIICKIAFHPLLGILFLPVTLLALLYADWKDIDSDVLN